MFRVLHGPGGDPPTLGHPAHIRPDQAELQCEARTGGGEAGLQREDRSAHQQVLMLSSHTMQCKLTVWCSLVWFIEGFMAPELYLRRGLTYTFKIEGGGNPRSAEYYHPFIITDEPVGGYDRLTEKQRCRVLLTCNWSVR